MKFIIFFIYIPFICSELHTLNTSYTAIRSQNLPGTLKVFAVTLLDGQQIDYYDSEIKKLIPKQNWMKEFLSGDIWKQYNDYRKQMQQIYENNIQVLMQQLNQSDGVHAYQRRYGCDWDNQTGKSHEFDQYGYDGDAFITLDVKKGTYNASVPQAELTAEKWNNDTEHLESLKNFQDKHVCVYWLKELSHFCKATFERAVLEPPEVFLTQKNPDSYVLCHVTGFYSSNTTITWQKNGQPINDSSKLVRSGEILPNGDGTYQRDVTLYVLPVDWKKDRQYVCVVMTLARTIKKTLTENEIIIFKKPATPLLRYGIITAIAVGIVVIVISVGLIVALIWKCWTQIKDGYQKVKTFIVRP